MDSPSSGSLADFPIVLALPVQWGDQDAYGHVNNTVFLRWFESSRIAYSGRIGLSALMAAERVGPILASITCHYRRQVTFPESIRVGARVTRIGRTSLTMEHQVVTVATDALAAEGTSTLVVFNYRDNHPEPIPESLRLAIEVLEGRPL